MWDILTGEFFWGVIIGLGLSFVGGWALAKITVALQERAARKMVVRFCIDTVKNIQSIIQEMDETRDRSQAIYHDFLTLIDVEIQTYGRNREHLIHLPDDIRASVRDFMNKTAIKKAEISVNLDKVYQLHDRAYQFEAQGLAPQSAQFNSLSNVALTKAQSAADKLAQIGKESDTLVTNLLELK